MIFSSIYGAIIHVKRARQRMTLSKPVPAGLIVNNKEKSMLVIKIIMIFILIKALCWNEKIFTFNLRIFILFKDRQYNEASNPSYYNLKKCSDQISEIKV